MDPAPRAGTEHTSRGIIPAGSDSPGKVGMSVSHGDKARAEAEVPSHVSGRWNGKNIRVVASGRAKRADRRWMLF